MLAYVFFHRPAAGTDQAVYENLLRRFHATLDLPSAGFRVDALPFGDGGPGYEDWYLVEDWAALGGLGDVALAAVRRREHDTVAGVAGEGWGGVWALVRGEARPPAGVTWTAKPAGRSYEDFLAGLDEPVVWQRQLVLGPAPEFALGGPPAASRLPVT